MHMHQPGGIVSFISYQSFSIKITSKILATQSKVLGKRVILCFTSAAAVVHASSLLMLSVPIILITLTHQLVLILFAFRELETNIVTFRTRADCVSWLGDSAGLGRHCEAWDWTLTLTLALTLTLNLTFLITLTHQLVLVLFAFRELETNIVITLGTTTGGDNCFFLFMNSAGGRCEAHGTVCSFELDLCAVPWNYFGVAMTQFMS